tara:strand:+ start:50 stop:1111 length:1062 start_codon:yes stop_codon:yes gene_type:complete
MKRVILTGGGTGGHCLPIQVIFNSFIQKEIDCYIITDKRGRAFFSSINKNKIITIWQLVESNNRFSQLLNFPIIFFQSLFIFLKLKPNFTIGFGGYITLPFLLSGSFLRYKIAVHESNAVLGRANKFLIRQIKYLFTAFNETQNIHKNFQNKTIHVGMPIRLYKSSKPIKQTSNNNFKICVIGGSQGAKSFSNFIPKAIVRLQNENNIRCIVNHQAREEDVNLVKNTYGVTRVESNVKQFFPDMPKIIFESDLVISRSGSSTLNEIIYHGKPSILIPYPHATDDHQYYNARELEKRLISKIIYNQELNTQKIFLEMLKILKNKARRKYIAFSHPKLGNLNPCERIYDLIKGDL